MSTPTSHVASETDGAVQPGRVSLAPQELAPAKSSLPRIFQGPRMTHAQWKELRKSASTPADLSPPATSSLTDSAQGAVANTTDLHTAYPTLPAKDRAIPAGKPSRIENQNQSSSMKKNPPSSNTPPSIGSPPHTHLFDCGTNAGLTEGLKEQCFLSSEKKTNALRLNRFVKVHQAKQESTLAAQTPPPSTLPTPSTSSSPPPAPFLPAVASPSPQVKTIPSPQVKTTPCPQVKNNLCTFCVRYFPREGIGTPYY